MQFGMNDCETLALTTIAIVLGIGLVLGALSMIAFKAKQIIELNREVDKFRDLYFDEIDKWRNKYIDNDYEAY